MFNNQTEYLDNKWNRDADLKYTRINNGHHSTTTIEPYTIQVVDVKENDVLLVHVSNNLNLEEMKQIQKEVEKCFPKNTILLANEHILKSMTIIRPSITAKTGEVKTIDISDDLSKWLEGYIGELEI